jgi:deoxyribodipyrimidine photo-lyase
MTSVVWLRRDPRIRDNAALAAAARLGEPTICVFIFDLDEDMRPFGGARRWWLHHSLLALGRALGSLVLLRGRARDLLSEFVKKTKATTVLWNRHYEPWVIGATKN